LVSLHNPLHVAADAMEGPTPSARSFTPDNGGAGLHALPRVFHLHADALTVIAWTAHHRVARRAHRRPAKRHQRILAYSTLSQLGYM